MRRQVIIIACLSATLIFLIRLFEARFLTGQISMKVYILVLGTTFLSVGILSGLRLARKYPIVKIVLKEPDITEAPNDFLTTRETELLTWVAKGLSNKEIAEQVFVSEHTVKKHLNNLYTKLNVSSRTQAIAKARTLGIIKA